MTRTYQEIAQDLAECQYALEKARVFQRQYKIIVCIRHWKMGCYDCEAEAKTASEDKAKMMFQPIDAVPLDDFTRIVKNLAHIYPDSWPYMKASVEKWQETLIKRWGPEVKA